MWKIDNIIKGVDTESKNCVAVVFYSNLIDNTKSTYDVCYGLEKEIDSFINKMVEARLNTLNNLVFNIETDKEVMKPMLIKWLYDHPGEGMEAFLEYAERTFGWYNRALVERLCYEYANNAILMGLSTGSVSSSLSAFYIITELVNAYEQDDLLKFF